MITYETNRYSVSPDLISSCVELRVDRMSGSAEVFFEGHAVKTLSLAQAGSRAYVMDEADRKAIQERWQRDRERRETRERRKKMKRDDTPEVALRHLSVYDEITRIQGGVQ
jgi:hypothetical protein